MRNPKRGSESRVICHRVGSNFSIFRTFINIGYIYYQKSKCGLELCSDKSICDSSGGPEFIIATMSWLTSYSAIMVLYIVKFCHPYRFDKMLIGQ